MICKYYKFFIPLAFCLISSTFASLGDDLPEFKKCVKYCDILVCGNVEKYHEVTPSIYQHLIDNKELSLLYDHTPVSFYMQMLGWDCFSDCDYQCTRLITEDRKKENGKIYQFHGKWPFFRVFGIQELFSTIFSIGNWIPNYYGFKLLYRHYSQEKKKGNTEFTTLYATYLVIPIVSMFAWFFSTVFHLKDTWDRERLDYFFAGMTVLSGFYGISVRYFQLYKTEKTSQRKVFGFICIFMYLIHVTRLMIDWSYTYNMAANVIIGLIQNFFWIALSISQFNKLANKKFSIMQNIKNKECNWALTPIALVASLLFGMSFELFDFPPMFELLDAHAMWHFCTIWPTVFWYPYMVKDVDGLKNMKFK